VKAWRNRFHDVIGHHWSGQHSYLGNSNVHGVVTYASPVEAFATGIKNLHLGKSSLIAWSLHSEALDHLMLREFKGQNVATPAKYVRKCIDQLILVAQNLSWSLDRLLKRMLIAWFHFDPGCKCFYRPCLCGYPLNAGTCPDLSSPCKGSSSETNQVLCFCTTHTRQFLFEI